MVSGEVRAGDKVGSWWRVAAGWELLVDARGITDPDRKCAARALRTRAGPPAGLVGWWSPHRSIRISLLELGVVGSSRKPDERRRPIHPRHFDRVDRDLRPHLFVEHGYGEDFGVHDDEIRPWVGGFRTRDELLATSDVVLLPKPQHDDVRQLRHGATLWGWPHLVQDPTFTQLAIDGELTVIAWESMNHWHDGAFSVHVFHLNNEIAGYAAVLHAMELRGMTGHYGRQLRAAVISFGATARGAVTALNSLGVTDVAVLTKRDVPAVASPIQTVVMGQFETLEEDPTRCRVLRQAGPVPMADFLAEYDIVVNCVFQDTDNPLLFVTSAELDRFPPGSLIIDVSCDEGMGFEWARPTSFDDPMFEVGDRVHHYGVDHTPSHLWESATWTISEALIPHLRTVLTGPSAWSGDEVIDRAVEIEQGRIRNPRILSFQGRRAEPPHPVTS